LYPVFRLKNNRLQKLALFVKGATNQPMRLTNPIEILVT
jgi:hypothetical protein